MWIRDMSKQVVAKMTIAEVIEPASVEGRAQNPKNSSDI